MSQSVGQCMVCQKPSTLRCSECHSAPYCGRQHQKDDWPKHKRICRSYEVKISRERGLYVVATKDIKKGEVVVDEVPLVVGPNYLWESSSLVCPGCHREDNFTRRCPACDWPVCSTKCPGLADATRHGAECPFLSKIKAAVILHSSALILPLRCLLLQKNDPKKWKVFQKMAEPALFLATNTSSNESMYLLQQSILKPLSTIAPEMLPDCSKERVQEVFAVLNAYGVDIEVAQFASLVAVCGVTSFMEHSCLPNTRRFVDIPPIDGERRGAAHCQLRCRVIVRATKDIPRGANISTLFMDTFMSTLMRQVSLASRRKLHCRCARCLDPRELGTDFGTLRCTNARCSGWVLPLDTLYIDFSHWKCQTCGKIYHFVDVYKLINSLKDEMDACRFGKVQNVQKYEAMLTRLEHFLHPNHHFCILMKERLSGLHGNLLVSGPGSASSMTDAQLKRTAELCSEVLAIMKNPAIVVHSFEKTWQCMLMLSCANIEIAKRKQASGEWDSAQADKVRKKSKEMVAEATRMRHSEFDKSSAGERLSVELAEKLSLLAFSEKTGV